MGGRHVRWSPVVKNVLVRGQGQAFFTNVVKNIQVASIYPPPGVVPADWGGVV
jgi:hypothetical protein